MVRGFELQPKNARGFITVITNREFCLMLNGAMPFFTPQNFFRRTVKIFLLEAYCSYTADSKTRRRRVQLILIKWQEASILLKIKRL